MVQKGTKRNTEISIDFFLIIGKGEFAGELTKKLKKISVRVLSTQFRI